MRNGAKTDLAVFLARSRARNDGARFVARDGMHGTQPDPQTFQIIGAAMEVHGHLHRGYFEAIYSEALAIEFELRGIPFHPQFPVRMEYKSRRLKGVHWIDFLCFGSVVVEIKAVSALTPPDEAQLLNYLAISQLDRGLLINFGGKSLEYKRRVL